MALSNFKITDADIAQKGVVAAPDKLTGTAEQNKMVFDRLIREAVRELFNGLIDALSCEDGAAEIGTSAIAGVTGGDVQTVLGSLKTILDTKAASADTTAALALKSDKSVTDLHVKSIALDAETGVFTVTREDGSFFTIDTVLEKVATNWQYDAATQSLVLTLADGTTQSVPLSAFITETEFSDSAQIAFSVSEHKVTATVKAGSITDTMLSSALIAQMQGYVSSASASASNAAQSETAAELYRTQAAGSASAAAASASAAATSESNAADSATAAAGSATAAAGSSSAAAGSASAASGSAEDAEAWAVGKRNGVDVASTDPAYQNNAKYYKEQASEIVGGDYATHSEVSAAVSGHNSANTAHSDIRQAVEGKADAAAFAGHSGDADIHVTAAQKTAWSAKQSAIKTTSVTLPAMWSGSGPYTQSVTIAGTTANSKVDLDSDAAVLAQMKSDKVTALYIVNNNGTLTACAIGAAPAAALTVQATITEVST